jgi:hypothetical protein
LFLRGDNHVLSHPQEAHQRRKRHPGSQAAVLFTGFFGGPICDMYLSLSGRAYLVSVGMQPSNFLFASVNS